MAPIIIFGIGHLADLAHFYFENDSKENVIGFTVDQAYCSVKEYRGLPVIPYEELEAHYNPSSIKLFIAMGYTGVNRIRRQRYEDAKKRGYQFASYISTKSIYFDNSFGDNCMIFEGNILQPYTEIGNNVIMAAGNVLSHNSRILDHVFVTTHVSICSDVIIGEQTFLGANCTIRDHVRIGRECLIGAGSTVLHDLDDFTVTRSPKMEILDMKSTEIVKI